MQAKVCYKIEGKFYQIIGAYHLYNHTLPCWRYMYKTRK